MRIPSAHPPSEAPEPSRSAAKARPLVFAAATAAALALAALDPSPARAQAEDGAPDALAYPEQIEVTLGGQTQWMTSSSARAVSGDGSNGLFAISAGLGLGRVAEIGDLFVDLTYAGGGTSDALFEEIDSEMSLHTLTASARLSRPMTTSTAAFARAGAGARRVGLELQSAGATARDRGWGPVALGSAGVEAAPFRDDAAELGLRAELGYAAEGGEGLSAEPADAGRDESAAISSRASSLGSLSARGPFFRIALVGRF